MTLFINVPIEPIENRYSIQWKRWFSKEIYSIIDPSASMDDLAAITIVGDSDGDLNIGSKYFLDPFSTNIYKSTQMAKIIDAIGDAYTDGCKNFVVFFHDLWFPGLEKLRYIESIMDGITIKIVGMLHAGTWDPHDLTAQSGMQIWSRPFEIGWLTIADEIFVATDFHKRLLTSFVDKYGSEQLINSFQNKITTTYLPFYNNDCIEDWSYSLKPTDFEISKKENWIAFPHRLSKEKGLEELKLFESELSKRGYSFEIKITQDICKNKKEFYDLLKKCKYSISFAYQETFGISIIESIIAGCIPIVPDALSYKETVFDLFRYKVEKSKPIDRVAAAIQLIEYFELYRDGTTDALLKSNAEVILARSSAAIQTMLGKSLSTVV